MGQRPGEPSYRGIPTAERPPPRPRGGNPAALLDEKALGKLRGEHSARLVEKRRLTAKRKEAVAQLRALKGEVKRQPLTEAQLYKEWQTGDLSEVALGMWNAGPGFRKWALLNRRFRLDTITKAYKKLILLRLATMVNIVATDEMLRSVINGVNPFSVTPLWEYVTPEVRELIQGNRILQDNISGMIKELKRTSYIRVKFGDPGFEMGLRLYLGAFNAGPKGQKVVRDWWDLFEEETRRLGARTPYDATQVNIKAAARAASRRYAKLVKKDPFYQGDETTIGFLRGTYRKVGKHAEVVSGGELDYTNEFIDAVTARCERMVQKKASMRHLHQGPSALRKVDLQNQDLMEKIYGYVQVEDSASVAHMAKELGMEVPLKKRLGNLLMHPDDAIFGVLEHLSTKLKEETFAKLYTDKVKYLKAHTKMSPEEIQQVAAKLALYQTETLSYSGTKSLFEQEMRNVFMFLPAYRQSLMFWGPRALKNPFKTAALLKGVSSQPDTMLTGETAWTLPHFASLFGMDMDDPLRSLMPPAGPALTLPLDIGASLTGSEQIRGWYKSITGFDTGFPFTTLRWAEAMTYGITGRYAPGWNKAIFEGFGEKFASERTIMEGRHNATVANLVTQAIASDGLLIDPAKARAHIAKLEFGRGAWNFAVPGNLRRMLPTITVTDPLLGPGPVKVNLAEMYRAQAAYLGAVTDADRNAVLKGNPAYAVISNAYELQGDAQLEYLNKHRWIIPFVVRKRAPSPNLDPASFAAEVGASPLTGIESMATRDSMTVEDYADQLRRKYKEVNQYVLAKAYQAEVTDAVEKGARAGYRADIARGATKATWYDYYNKWVIPVVYRDGKPITQMAKAQQAFLKAHYNDIMRATKAKPDDPDYGVLAIAPGDKEPAWVSAMHLSSSEMSDKTFDLFHRLESTGDKHALAIIEDNPLFGLYEQEKVTRENGRRSKIIYAAMKQYKSNLDDEQLRMLGVEYTDKNIEQLHQYLIIVGQEDRKKKRFTFGTSEYWGQYYASKKVLADAKVRLGISDKNMRILSTPPVQILLRLGLNKPNLSPIREGGKHSSVSAAKMWEEIKAAWNDPNKTLKDVLALRDKASPGVQARFDELNRAWQWGRVLAYAYFLHERLRLSYNVYTHQAGYSVESKTMGLPLMKIAQYIVRSASEASPDFAAEYQLYQTKSGVNFIKDLLDPSR